MRNLFTASVFALLFIGLPANAQKRSLAEAAKVATGFFHTEEVDAMQMKEEEGSRRLQKKVMEILQTPITCSGTRRTTDW